MSAFALISSALPPKADVAAVGRESPKLTHSGNCLVLGLHPDCLTLSGVGLPLGYETLGFGDLFTVLSAVGLATDMLTHSAGRLAESGVKWGGQI